MGSGCDQGGRPVRIPDPNAPPPPSPPDPPKFSNPSFSNLRFLGKVSAPSVLLALLRGYFFLPHVSIVKVLRILWRKAQKKF